MNAPVEFLRDGRLVVAMNRRAMTILGAAAAMGALPPLPRRHAPARHAEQTPEQRDRAIAKAEAKRARKRARNAGTSR